jgi:hypothetical protein
MCCGSPAVYRLYPEDVRCSGSLLLIEGAKLGPKNLLLLICFFGAGSKAVKQYLELEKLMLPLQVKKSFLSASSTHSTVYL